MRLNSVKIEGFRSIKESLTLHCDPRVTVVLGANDHGKSNILEAIRYLNADQKFDADKDLNWDCAKSQETLPHIEFNLELGDDDKAAVLAMAKLYQAIDAAEAELGRIDQQNITSEQNGSG